MSFPRPATEEAGGDFAPAAAGSEPFGPNSAEVSAFIDALGKLTGAQWRKVLTARRSAGSLIRDPTVLPAEAVRAMLRGEANGGIAPALAGILEPRSDEEVVTAWQAASALARRRQLSPLTFAAHYAPFAALIPPAAAGPVSPSVDLFTKALRWLGEVQWQALARPWTLDREAAAALLQAAIRSRTREAEEAAALAAIGVAHKHLSGDAGWAAVKTAVHGSRVLSCRPELTTEQLTTLWAPLEEAVALRSLDDRPAPLRAAAPVRAAAPAPRRKPVSRRGPLYGPNSADVAALVKLVPALTAIQWLRLLDRRQLVASVTRERSVEPAAVVRADLAAIGGTSHLDQEARCRTLMAVERAGYALESKEHLTVEQAAQHYGPVAEVIPFDEVDAGTFAGRVAALNPEEWMRLSGLAPAVDVATTLPLLNAGDALAAHLADRSDEEISVTWQALAALVNRQNLSPIKFAVSFAPFASGVVVVKPKSLAPFVQRYLIAIGRLSAHQCALLAEPWLLPDDVSSKLSAAVTDGSARAAEEAAALTALVTVPMRLTGDAGWAAAKTAAYGARVAASRDKVSDEDFVALWKPLERAIPIASLEAPKKSKS
ncbi:MAG TPA: hypothetical protein VFO75_01785 [Candidatus Dormibacteraeota bacterium]|nr:hypothetical protein [Candidatus Dormibacteraeota bacterium]